MVKYKQEDLISVPSELDMVVAMAVLKHWGSQEK